MISRSLGHMESISMMYKLVPHIGVVRTKKFALKLQYQVEYGTIKFTYWSFKWARTTEDF